MKCWLRDVPGKHEVKGQPSREECLPQTRRWGMERRRHQLVLRQTREVRKVVRPKTGGVVTSFSWRVKCLEKLRQFVSLSSLLFCFKTRESPTYLSFLLRTDRILTSAKDHHPPSTHSRFGTKPSIPFTTPHCSAQSELFSSSRVPIPTENSEAQPLQPIPCRRRDLQILARILRCSTAMQLTSLLPRRYVYLVRHYLQRAVSCTNFITSRRFDPSKPV